MFTSVYHATSEAPEQQAEMPRENKQS